MSKVGLKLTDNQRFLLRNVSIIVLGLFINQLLQTLGSIVLARLLDDPVRFGEVNLLLQIFGMVALFLNVGFNSSLVYTFSTNAEEAIHRKFRVALAGSTFFGVVVSVAMCILAPVLAASYGIAELKGALMLSSVTLFFNSIVNIGVASFSGNRDFRTQAFFMVVMTTFSTAAMIMGVLVPFHDLLWGVSLWTGIGSALTAAFICWKVARVHRPRWRGAVRLAEMKDMMKYGVPMWAGNIAKAFQQPFLVMMIGSISVVAVGQLANASRITGFIGIITWAFMIVTLPFVAESAHNPKESSRRGTLCIRYNNLILYPLTAAICIFPDEINGFLFGSGYTTPESATYIRLLALGVFFSSVGRLGGNILAGIGKTKANFWVMILAGIIVIALVPVLVKVDAVWAVWVYTASWAVSAFVMIYFFFVEGFSPDWWKAYGQPFVPTAVMTALILIGRLSEAWLPYFVVVGVISLLALTMRIESKKGLTIRSIRLHR
ncbi:oligosaccharide flippase family protein [Paenibacillus puerhi]|uniref:oligosaccharide flippase family protein n=1 Tax=Paenibacillus puerhi TaxID=2692622 RepID=UPI00135C8C70|nr:oligosaccharide flippase family protein [Paenibacillus puerhi]